MPKNIGCKFSGLFKNFFPKNNLDDGWNYVRSMALESFPIYVLLHNIRRFPVCDLILYVKKKDWYVRGSIKHTFISCSRVPSRIL